MFFLPSVCWRPWLHFKISVQLNIINGRSLDYSLLAINSRGLRSAALRSTSWEIKLYRPSSAARRLLAGPIDPLTYEHFLLHISRFYIWSLLLALLLDIFLNINFTKVILMYSEKNNVCLIISLFWIFHRNPSGFPKIVCTKT